MNKTPIEWVKNPDGTQGYTWNPITGCLNGCEYCYARKLANTRLRKRYLANFNLAGVDCANTSCPTCGEHPVCNDSFYPRFWEDRMSAMVQVRRGGKVKPKGYFTCDMSDLFGIGIPEEWTARVLDVIKGNWQDRFYLLTKQPQNLIKFSPFPDNCWVGVSVTGKEEDGFVYPLIKIKSKVKFLSFEPLLAPVKIGNNGFTNSLENAGIKCVIIGAQTKPYKPPKIEWVQEIVEACDKAEIPVFLKYNLVGHLPVEEPFYHNDGFGWAIRQEMPKRRGETYAEFKKRKQN